VGYARGERQEKYPNVAVISSRRIPLFFPPRSYQSILSDSDTAASSVLSSFILSASSRRGEDAARYGSRPSYSAPLEESTPKISSEEKTLARATEREIERKEDTYADRVERGAKGGTPSERTGSPLHTPEDTLAQRTAAPGPAPQAIKKNPATPNDFFPQPHPGRTLITFLSEITLRGERRGGLSRRRMVTALIQRAVGRRRGNTVGGGGSCFFFLSFSLYYFLSFPFLFILPPRSHRPTERYGNPPPSLPRRNSPLARSRDVRPDYEMLNGSGGRAGSSLLIQILFLLAIGPARISPLARGRGGALLGQRAAAPRPLLTPLFFRSSLFPSQPRLPSAPF